MSAETFTELWEPALAELDTTLANARRNLIQAVSQREQFLSLVFDKLMSNRNDESRLAATVIEEQNVQSIELVNKLKSALAEHPSDESTGWLLSAMQTCGSEEDIDYVATFVEHINPDVRDVAATVVSALGWPTRSNRSVETMLALASDNDSEVRFSACWELGSWFQGGFEDKRIAHLLSSRRDDGDDRIRLVVEETLGS